MISKVVIPAAGLGTRLFPVTKEHPKEMLPIFSQTLDGSLMVKPVVQLVFEQLYEAGLREFCYVVGRGKRSLEDHFTPDPSTIKLLGDMGKDEQAADFESFYEKLRTSTIMWVNQIESKGFGSAVLTAQPFVQDENCLVHAGDSVLVSKDMNHLKLLMKAFDKYDADAAFILLEIENPQQYGIVEGKEIRNGIFKVHSVVEKPEKPATNLAIMAMYAFQPVIFKALEKTQPDKKEEVQLTGAIEKLIDWGLNVIGVKMSKDYVHVDVGSPERFWEALSLSHVFFGKDSKQAFSDELPETSSSRKTAHKK